MRRVILWCVATISMGALLPGCGGSLNGCDFREGSANGSEQRCQERDEKLPTGVETFKLGCSASQGKYVEGGCPTGYVAGCKMDSAGQTVTDWYYPPTTREQVVTECGDDGDVVDP